MRVGEGEGVGEMGVGEGGNGIVEGGNGRWSGNGGSAYNTIIIHS